MRNDKGRSKDIYMLQWQQELKDGGFPIDSDRIQALRMAIEALKAQEPRGVYQCFHCVSQSVIWDADYDFSDFGYEGEGVVHMCHCTNCGAEIEYRVPITNEEDNDAV